MGAVLSYFSKDNWQGTMILLLGAIAAVFTAKGVAEDYADDSMVYGTLLRFGVAFLIMYVVGLFASYYVAWNRCTSGIYVGSVLSQSLWPALVLSVSNLIFHVITFFLKDPFFYAIFTLASYITPLQYILFSGPAILGAVGCTS